MQFYCISKNIQIDPTNEKDDNLQFGPPYCPKVEKNTRSFVKFASDGYALWSVVLDKLLKLIFLFENEK